MSKTSTPIFIGDSIQQPSEGDVKGEFVTMLGGTFYRIQNYDHLAPFFMSLVSSSKSLAIYFLQRWTFSRQDQCRTIPFSLLHRG